ncbi:restriction endonuclease subunit S [Coprococcus sp. RTP31081st1_H3_RTP31081_211007]|uniref:restriction endonuclease subunit S n=1 Tax=unclassified Coprococcus TaxID=2684943 RepID=UPI0032EFC1A6
MKYKLKDIFDLQMGKTPSRNNIEYWNTKDFKWISISDLTKAHGYISETKEYISERAVSESGIKIIPANTVVMSFKLSIGKTAITSEDMYSNEAIMAFHDKHVVEILPEYIFYIFKYKKWDEDSNNAVMGKTLNKAILSEAEIEICSIEEQRAIVDILDNMMSVLESRGTELDLLDNLIKARFVEMFGDPKINPRQYPVSELSEYIEFLTSGSRGWAKYCTDDGTEWFITIKNVKDCRISVNNIQSVNAPGNAEAIRTKVQEGDLLISITADLGRTGVVTKEIAEHGAYINQHLTCIRLNKKILDPLYVAYFMESNAGKEQFESKNQSAVKAGLNFNSITSLRIMIPPISVQKEFISFVHQVDKSKLLSLIKLLEQLITYLYNVFIIYRQDKGEEVERHE